jgi:preprotein translocase subunit SecG
MSTFETILVILLVLDALSLAVLVLLQQGQGANVGAAFGSGASNTMFGSAGSTSFLTKLTVWLAVGFFIISFGLAYTAKERAARLGTIGVPQVTEPATGEQSQVLEKTVKAKEAPQELTPEPESVDSDIPDV